MKEKAIFLTENVSVLFETPTDKQSVWFGYYNYDTINASGSKMLCNKITRDGVAPEKGMKIELGYYELSKSSWHLIGNSDSWNWQQGAMMQWLPGDGNDNKIVYNTSDGHHLFAFITDIENGKSKRINWPIYGLTPDGKKSISIDLERSYWCRAYHYESVVNESLNVAIPENDGIFEIDLDQNSRRRILSIDDVLRLDPDQDFPQLKHWFEHVMISPNGKRFCFLHRFSPLENPMLYQTRLIISDIDGTNLQVVPGWREYSLSHFGWKDDESFVIYAVKIPSIQKTLSSAMRISSGSTISHFNYTLLKKEILSFAKAMLPRKLKEAIKGNDNGYHYYRINSDGKFSLKEKWTQKLFRIDGHPSFTGDGRYMITDTYPDERKMQHLIVFDTITKKGVVVAEFFASLMSTPASCDLHPKLCRNNNYVVIDTAYDYRHHMILLKLNWDIIKKQISNNENNFN